MAYMLKGERVKERTGLRLIDSPATPLERQQNKETLRSFNAICAQKQIELANDTAKIPVRKSSKKNLCEYLCEYAEGYAAATTRRNYISLLSTWRRLMGDGLLLSQVTAGTAAEFAEALKAEGKKDTTIKMYIRQLVTMLRAAKRAGYLSDLPDISSPEAKPTKRQYLTAAELEKFKADFREGETKRLFLFSCYTGLRYSDLINLRYSDIEKGNDRYILSICQQKTGGRIYIPMPAAALQLIDKGRIGLGDLVFPNRSGNKRTLAASAIRPHLHEWGLTIGKNVSIHTARHTFAVLLLSEGADLYNVSRLLGHTSLKTTQIYADMTAARAKDTMDLLDKL